ncbi:MAG: hypothetical protein P8123_08515, partial [bacterium]
MAISDCRGCCIAFDTITNSILDSQAVQGSVVGADKNIIIYVTISPIYDCSIRTNISFPRLLIISTIHQ